jgi:hypothetical protein
MCSTAPYVVQKFKPGHYQQVKLHLSGKMILCADVINGFTYPPNGILFLKNQGAGYTGRQSGRDKVYIRGSGALSLP